MPTATSVQRLPAFLFVFLLILPGSLRAQSTGAITGTVTDVATGAPLAGVNVSIEYVSIENVSLEDVERGASTNAEGYFEITRLTPGEYTLQASLIGYGTARRTVMVEAGRTTRLEIAMASTTLELAEVVVSGRAANLVGIAQSASQGRVGPRQIQTRPLLRTGEVMETVPGLIATQHSGSGKANQFFLRGFNLDHGTDFATSVEGVPINLRTHAHGQGYLDLNFLIPELIEVVRFKKGPYYASGGDFATAGQAQVGLVERLDEGIAEVTVGTDEYYEGLLADSWAVGSGDLLVGLRGRYYNGPWVLPEQGKLASGVMKYSLGDDSEGYSLTGLGYYSDWNSSDQIPLRAVEDGQISRFGHVDSTDGGTTGRYTLVGNWWKGGENGARTKASVYAAYYHLDLFSNFSYFLAFPERGDQFEQADRRAYAGARVSHRWLTGWFGRRSAMTAGAELRHDQIFEVGLYNTENRVRFNTVRSDEVAETSLGLYLENETQWLDKLRTIVGLRGDVFRFDVESNIEVNSGTETDFIASPKFALILGPWSATEFYLNAGLGYHSNDARGTTIEVDPVTRAAVERVDPLVRSRGAELGARTAAIEGLQSSLALWYIGLESELVFVGDAGGTEASGASEHYGVEWTNFYRATDWLALNLDVALTESHFVDDTPEDNEIGNSIGRIITGGVSAGFPTGWLGSLRLRHFGPRPLTGDGSIISPSTTLLNAKVGYGFANVTVELDVLNLLNAADPDISYFYPSRLRGEAPDGVSGVHFHPVLPRSARLSATWRF